MNELRTAFDERLYEVEEYLAFLSALEQVVSEGTPRIGSTVVTVEQQRILYSGVFLQLYNLVEATVNRCVNAIAEAAASGEKWTPGDLSDQVRKEWVRFTARTHIDLNYHHRLEAAINLCDRLIQVLPVSHFAIQVGGGGNWDENEIETISTRLGFELQISSDVYSRIKRHFRNENGALASIKYYRNSLAHGSLSFAECGDGLTVRELIDLKDATANYLREVVLSFESAIDRYEFLLPERRPV